MTKLGASLPDPTNYARTGTTYTGIGEQHNYSSYTRTYPPFTGTVGVFIVYGQSNCANFVDSNYTVTNPTHNLQLDSLSGGLYQMKEPVLGCNGGLGYNSGLLSGNWTSQLGDKLVAAGKYANVVIINVGSGATSSSSWTPTGSQYPRLRSACHRAINFKYPLTGIILHQGETDATSGTTAAAYTANVLQHRAAIDSFDITAPLIVCQVSVTPTTALGSPASTAVRTGQANSANGTTIKLGPDADTATGANRHDGLHYNITGAGLMATAMKDWIVANL